MNTTDELLHIIEQEADNARDEVAIKQQKLAKAMKIHNDLRKDLAKLKKELLNEQEGSV